MLGKEKEKEKTLRYATLHIVIMTLGLMLTLKQIHAPGAVQSSQR